MGREGSLFMGSSKEAMVPPDAAMAGLAERLVDAARPMVWR